ncbi:hypothetical protein [Luteimonas sp. A478]
MRKAILAGMVGVVLLGSASASAQDALDEHVVMQSEAFLTAHPDLNNRRRGMAAYEVGRYKEALTFFRGAARYADKPSQAMVGEMLWKGEGTSRDPALAYAWMDLAAERGYPGFTVIRERLWAGLDDAQREDALVRGEQVYAEYGDAVSRPRIDQVLRRERRRTTGSRTGFVGFLEIRIPGPGGIVQSIDGNRFYDPKYWEPEQYHAWQDAVWTQLPAGRVDIGDVEPLRRDDAPENDD